MEEGFKKIREVIKLKFLVYPVSTSDCSFRLFDNGVEETKLQTDGRGQLSILEQKVVDAIGDGDVCKPLSRLKCLCEESILAVTSAI
ncbi:hypothetical protein CTI12_AA202700 [Artemisia annua]|uniref:Uncharacterized protein n=1 Tax=Artemisia annua TaxID=35608 RepID=A0A2U1P1S5_ARTAN|nr:hypothetical protein CTI12_AA202700 [Artemisia annua]